MSLAPPFLAAGHGNGARSHADSLLGHILAPPPFHQNDDEDGDGDDDEDAEGVPPRRRVRQEVARRRQHLSVEELHALPGHSGDIRCRHEDPNDVPEAVRLGHPLLGIHQEVECAEIEPRSDEKRCFVLCHNSTPSKGLGMSVHHAMDILILQLFIVSVNFEDFLLS